MKRLSGKGRRRTGNCSRSYDLRQSPFYRLERRSDLARLLQMRPSDLEDLIANRESLYLVRDEEVGGKVRSLAVPIRSLRRCHERLFSLLRRIRLPDFILCPRRNIGPADNALLHRDSANITSFDIRAFYPSTTDRHIFQFFRNRMEMSSDCARQLAMLCTRTGRLPLGSPMSPHLACLAHLDLFEGAASRADRLGFKTSVWVDDVTISGSSVRRDLVSMIRRKAEQKGLEIHKLRRGSARFGLVLTGSYIRGGHIAVANSSHLRVRDLTEELRAETDPAAQFRLLNRLAAMARHQRTVLRQSGEQTSRIDARLQFYRREMKRLQGVLSITMPSRAVAQVNPNSPVF